MTKLALTSLALKYAAGAVMLGMLFALVWAGKLPADQLDLLLVAGLSALFGHASGLKSTAPVAPLPTPPQS